jgi:hypothetical protein
MARSILILASLLALTGCNETRDQAVADQAASVYEIGVALERGADPLKAAAGLKASGAAIIHALGFTYAPAADLIKALSAPKESP